MRCPRFIARLRPSAVRVRIRSRSTSAKPPRTAIIKRPVLVPVSAHGSASERNCALASTICSTMANTSKVLRARWSIRVTVTSPEASLPSILLSSHRSLVGAAVLAELDERLVGLLDIPYDDTDKDAAEAPLK